MNNQNFQAGAYNLIKTLRDAYFLANHDASYMRKHDYEKAMIDCQEHIEWLLGRELTTEEVDDLDEY